MTFTAKMFLSMVAAGLLATPVVAQTQAPPCKPAVSHKYKKHEKVTPCAAEQQLADLQAQLKAQQAQIDALSQQLKAQATPAETDPIATPIANKAAADASAASAQAADASATANGAKVEVDGVKVAEVKDRKDIDDLESPMAIHYKGILLQPGGFAAAETVARKRTLNSNIATPFSAIPYGNSNNAYISEFNGSAGQSRISLLATAPVSFGKAGAYFEGDFLGAGTTSNNNQTNSYVFRVRSAFGYMTTNSGFTIQAGQMFTMATEDKKGILAGPGAEALPPTIDPNYIVGFNFGRQYAIRIAQSLAGGKVNVGFAAEGSQIIFTGSNAPDNFFFGGAGNAGGLFNSTGGSSGGGSATAATPGVQNYTDNLAPDLHAKITFDPGIGHYEIGGIFRLFRDRVYPQTTFSSTSTATDSTIGTNYTTPGGGIYASARVPFGHYLDVALKGAAGDGTARYEASNLGDVTARPSGQLEPLRTYSGLFEIDLHPTKKLDIFVLTGAAYLQRTTYIAPGTTTQVGYGGITTINNTGCSTQTAPVNDSGNGFSSTPACTGTTRYLYEVEPGFTYRFFNSPTKGRFQFQATAEYIDRESWQGYGNGTSFATANFFHGAQATEPQFHTSFRYYIP